MQKSETSFNDMQTVKRRFFAMRNGVITDTLRRAGSPFSIIFGLNLPQISEIAAETPHTRDLAERLWANSTTRESMMIAPMLVDVNDFSLDDALRWIADVKAAEIADVLCLKLLRRTPYALDLADRLSHSDSKLGRYTGLRLMMNLVAADPARALDYAREVEKSETDHANIYLARQIIDEAQYLLE